MIDNLIGVNTREQHRIYHKIIEVKQSDGSLTRKVLCTGLSMEVGLRVCAEDGSLWEVHPSHGYGGNCDACKSMMEEVFIYAGNEVANAEDPRKARAYLTGDLRSQIQDNLPAVQAAMVIRALNRKDELETKATDTAISETLKVLQEQVDELTKKQIQVETRLDTVGKKVRIPLDEILAP